MPHNGIRVSHNGINGSHNRTGSAPRGWPSFGISGNVALLMCQKTGIFISSMHGDRWRWSLFDRPYFSLSNKKLKSDLSVVSIVQRHVHVTGPIR
jgi:hypothetical protein